MKVILTSVFCVTCLIVGLVLMPIEIINRLHFYEVSVITDSKNWTSSEQLIILINEESFYRENEIVSVERNKLKEPSSRLFPMVKEENKILCSQLSDTNSDGLWDRLLIEVSLRAHEKDTLKIEWVTKENLPEFKNKTNIRFSYKSKTGKPTPEIERLSRLRGFSQDSNPLFQLEGPGIENDKVAFRIFFDKRNSKDIYGKLTDEMILDNLGLKGNWHELQDWGMDILHTGESIGAGGLAIKEEGIVYPLSDADNSFYTLIEEGSLSASLDLRFVNWGKGILKNKGSERISIKKGDYFYKDEVTVHLNKKQNLVCGMPNFSADSPVFIRHNEKFSSISTYGNQADGTLTSLGLAVMFPTKDYAGKFVSNSRDMIYHSYYAALTPSNNSTQNFYFFACWELSDKRFTTKDGFNKYLQETADKLANPIQIVIKN